MTLPSKIQSFRVFVEYSFGFSNREFFDFCNGFESNGDVGGLVSRAAIGSQIWRICFE